jgi:predicted DNA-binding transcriptional regulator AlpA
MNALSIRDVIVKTSLGRTAIYDAVAAGRFPAPAHFGYRSFWDAAEVDAWLAERFAERDRQLAQGDAQ